MNVLNIGKHDEPPGVRARLSRSRPPSGSRPVPSLPAPAAAAAPAARQPSTTCGLHGYPMKVLLSGKQLCPLCLREAADQKDHDRKRLASSALDQYLSVAEEKEQMEWGDKRSRCF